MFYAWKFAILAGLFIGAMSNGANASQGNRPVARKHEASIGRYYNVDSKTVIGGLGTKTLGSPEERNARAIKGSDPQPEPWRKQFLGGPDTKALGGPGAKTNELRGK